MRAWAAIAACLLLAAAPAAASAAPLSEAEKAKIVSEGLGKDPLFGVVWKTLERDFPEEAQGIYAFAARRSDQASGEELGMAIAQRVSRFIQENAAAMADAPDGELRAFAASTAELYRVLKRGGVDHCMAAAYTGSLGMDADMTPDQMRASRDRILVMLQTIKAGRSTPVKRDALSKADVDMMLTGMKALGASEAVIKAASDPKALEAASAETKCDGAILMMDSLARMPGPEAGRFISVILRRIGGDPAAGFDMAKEKFDKPVRFYLDAMQADPQAGPSWKLLEEAYPDKIMAMATRFVEALRRGETQGAIDGLKAESARMIETERMWVVKAPDDKVQAFAKAMAAHYRALQADDADRCALFAMQGVMPPEPFSEPVARSAIALHYATVDAIVAGRRTPTDRDEPTETDRSLYRERLKRSAYPREIVRALSGGGLEGMTPHQQCQGTIAMLETVAALPPEVSARMMVEVFLGAREAEASEQQPT